MSALIFLYGYGHLETLAYYEGSLLNVLSRDTRLAWVDRETGKNPSYIYTQGKTLDDRLNWIKNNIASKKRYTIEWEWRGKNYGHITHLYKNSKNELSLYDPQTGINLKSDDTIRAFLNDCVRHSLKLLSVEDCDINMNVANPIMTKREHK